MIGRASELASQREGERERGEYYNMFIGVHGTRSCPTFTAVSIIPEFTTSSAPARFLRERETAFLSGIPVYHNLSADSNLHVVNSVYIGRTRQKSPFLIWFQSAVTYIQCKLYIGLHTDTRALKYFIILYTFPRPHKFPPKTIPRLSVIYTRNCTQPM